MLIGFQGKRVWGVGNQGYGGVDKKTFIPAMLGQVGKGSLEIKLLQMCYPGACECSLVSKENVFGVWEIKGMGGWTKKLLFLQCWGKWGKVA